MKLSIIIPAYNAANYIERCLNSLYIQNISLNEYEIIVVNDGSTDNTLDIVYKIRRNNTSIISQKNAKQGAARNRGLEIAKGDYIWFVDADDYVEKNVLVELLSIAYSENLDILNFEVPQKNNGVKTGSFYLINHLIPIAPWSSFYRREFLQINSLRFQEGVVYEDSEFIPRAFFFAKRVLDINIHAYNYFMSETSITNKNLKIEEWLLTGLLKNVLSLKKFGDNVENNDINVSKSIYFYSSKLFNTFIYRIRYSKFNYSTDICNQLSKNKYGIIRMFLQSRNCKYMLEGIVFLLPSFFCINILNKILRK